MSDLLRTGLQFLETKRKSFMSSDIVYSRGTDSVTVKATKGKTEFTSIGDTFEIGGEIIDFLITADDLILDSSTVKPVIGDKITETIDSVDYVYEVLNLAGDGCYRYSDPDCLTYRIHTKLIDID